MHKRFDDLVLRYSAGSLDEDEQAQVEQHLIDESIRKRTNKVVAVAIKK